MTELIFRESDKPKIWSSALVCRRFLFLSNQFRLSIIFFFLPLYISIKCRSSFFTGMNITSLKESTKITWNNWSFSFKEKTATYEVILGFVNNIINLLYLRRLCVMYILGWLFFKGGDSAFWYRIKTKTKK